MLRKLAAFALLATLLPIAHIAHAQQIEVFCNSSLACNDSTGPSNTGTGDPLWKFGGKANAMFAQLYAMFGSGSNLAVHGSVIYSDISALWSGTPTSSNCLGSEGSLISCSSSGGAPG